MQLKKSLECSPRNIEWSIEREKKIRITNIVKKILKLMSRPKMKDDWIGQAKVDGVIYSNNIRYKKIYMGHILGTNKEQTQ